MTAVDANPNGKKKSVSLLVNGGWFENKLCVSNQTQHVINIIPLLFFTLVFRSYHFT
jgi:hypothetical protein